MAYPLSERTIWGFGPLTTAIRNIGLLAHVDAGKTTTTEQMLYHAGRIRTAGRVDDGTTQTDYLDVERQRGISVRMAATVLPWKGCEINLVDTPGHTDFVSEVERSLQVLDGVVLVISAAEGVQSHTETLWHALRSRGVPTLLYINKVDRWGADPARVFRQIQSTLTDRAIPIQALPPTERDCRCVTGLPPQELLGRLAELDDDALERYLGDGQLDPAWLQQRLAQLTSAGQAFPVLFGSSLRGVGIPELLDAVVALLPPPVISSATVSGVVFKVERDPAMGRLAYVRLYGGTLHPRDAVLVAGRAEPARIVQIRKMYARHQVDAAVFPAGDIGVLCGLGAVRAGDTLGDPAGVPPLYRMAQPVLRVRVWPLQTQALPRLLAALQELSDEDPHLEVQWQPEVRELNLTVMGPIQVEIIQSLLTARFGIHARFDPPTVIYRETPVGTGEGEVTYVSPIGPGYARVQLRVEPGAPGSGLSFTNRVRHDDLYPQFAAEVERTVPQVLQQGLWGWLVTDLHVSLIGGAFDSIVTTVGDYTHATPMALMSALSAAGVRLLEPVYHFRLSLPADCSGRVMAELLQMRSLLEPPNAEGDRLHLTGTVPVATFLGFPARLSGLTAGRGALSVHPAGYQPAPPAAHAERPRTGIDPLDRPRYLLALRGALKA